MAVEKWSENVTVIRLADDPQFTDELLPLAQPGTSTGPHLVLDLGGVRFLNSSNLSILLKLRKQVSSSGAQLVLCNVGTEVWGVFLITGLDKIFQFSADVSTALLEPKLRAHG